MAGNHEVRLNLVLSAKDEAKAVIEGFVNTLKVSFAGLGEQLAKDMGMNDITKAVESAASTIKKDLDSINTKETQTAFEKMAETAFKTRREIEVDFEAVKASFGNMSLEAVKASELTVQQMLKIIKAADEDGPKIEAYKNKFQESFDKIAQSSFKTREQLETDFDKIKASFENESLSAIKASDMTTQALSKMVSAATETEISVVNSLKKIPQAAEEAGPKIKEALDFMNLQMAGQMIEGVGQKITGFFGNAVKANVDFDQSVVNTVASLNSNLPAGIRLSTQEMESMRQKSLEMGKAGFFSANQIAESMNTLARQGINYKEIMGGAIQTVADVAAANQTDIEGTANVVSDIIHEMGDSLQQEFGGDLKTQLTGVGDAMTGALHHARITMDDFLNTMKYVGPQASSMKVGVGELSASIALLGEHGIKGSQAGTTLRRELTNLTPQSKEAAATMRELGLITANGANVFYDSAGKMKSLTEVQRILHTTLSGLNDEQKQLAIKTIFGQYALSGMTAIVDTAPEKFHELTDAMHKTGITADLIRDKKIGLGFVVQQLTSHYQTIIKEIGHLLEGPFRELLVVLQKVMNAWDGLSAPAKTAIAVISAVTGAVLLVGGALIAAIAGIGMFSTAITAGMGVLAAISGPILIVIGVIAALGLAIYGLKYAWDRDLGGIQEKTKIAWDWIKTQFNAAISYIAPYVKTFINELKAWWTEMSGTFEKAIKNIWNFIVWLTPLWEAAWWLIKEVAAQVFDAIYHIIHGAFLVLKGVFDFFLDLFAGNWSHMWKDLEDIVVGAVELIWGYINLSFFGKLIKEAALFVKAFGKFFIDLGVDVLNSVTKMVVNIRGEIDGLVGRAFDWGKNLIQMFIDGISSMVGKVVDTVKNVAGKVSDFLGFHSPTREGPAADSDTWMPNMMTMLTDGVTKNTPKMQEAVNNVSLGLKSSFSGTNVTNVSQSTSIRPSAASNGGKVVNITINVDGRNAQNDNALAEKIANAFRTQISMAVV